jgi:hypothetical protein
MNFNEIVGEIIERRASRVILQPATESIRKPRASRIKIQSSPLPDEDFS